MSEQMPSFSTKLLKFLFFFSAFDVGAETLWETHNQGKLWKHIKAKYEEKEN